jgi:hypothetical protein
MSEPGGNARYNHGHAFTSHAIQKRVHSWRTDGAWNVARNAKGNSPWFAVDGPIGCAETHADVFLDGCDKAATTCAAASLVVGRK